MLWRSDAKNLFEMQNEHSRCFGLGNCWVQRVLCWVSWRAFSNHKRYSKKHAKNKKKLENQTNLDNGTMNNQLVSPNTISNNLSPIKNDNNQPNTPTSLSDKKATIINRVAAKEVIEEENISNKSMDSDIDEEIE